MEEKVSYQRNEGGVLIAAITWSQYFLYLGGWSVCGLGAMSIGRRKMRPLLGSGFLSAIFGPLALVMAVILPPRKPTHTYCPYCNFAIPLGARVCGHCQTILVRRYAPINVTPGRRH